MATYAALRNPKWRFAAVLVGALTLAALLVAASQLSAARADSAEPPRPAEPTLFAKIEQRGAALGSPRAPVTLVEYADLQCPYCAQWAHETLPVLVSDYVKTGKLRIVFRGLAFIGPDSDEALRTAIAAGHQDRLWDIVHGLYASQGAENSGWVTDDLVREIAAGVPGLDGDELLENRWTPAVEREQQHAAAKAEAAGIRSTPTFQVGPTGGKLRLVQLHSLAPEGIVPAIEEVLAR